MKTSQKIWTARILAWGEAAEDTLERRRNDKPVLAGLRRLAALPRLERMQARKPTQLSLTL